MSFVDSPTYKDLWFLPLGGCGEIGMNLNLYAHDGHWLMVDCGITFEKSPDQPLAGNRVEMADPVFIANRSESLVGLVATHAHEDHIGAIAHVWDQFRCPIYTTPFTRNVLLRKLREKGLDAPVITVRPGGSITLGPFQLSWIPITHSTPETNALLISTRAGRVLHTADWKIDPAPVVGDALDSGTYRSLGQLGIDAIVCDSTNATEPGHSVSEGELFEDLLAAVRQSPGRVVIACFASNIARLQTLGNVAHVAGRYLGVLGRSLHNMVACARAAGYLQEHFELVNNTDLGYLLPAEVMTIATGSQGEMGAALHRLAMDSHPDINLSAGDHIIFSAKTIPGNEEDVARLIRGFAARGIQVTHADHSDCLLHASGHPCADELTQMYQWIKPRVAIPVHGEKRHMARNAVLASEAGVPFTLTGHNGDLFDLVQDKVIRGAAPVGRLWYDEEKRLLKPVPVS